MTVALAAPRTVRQLHPALRDDIGDLVTRRPLPGPHLPHLDPFLFLNHHGPQTYGPHNQGLPFGPHPHRGFETVTFILEGSLTHSDTGGHESIIHAGGVQWMTAGRGLVHAELSPEAFKKAGGPLEILQLWVNLPARLKMVAPAYKGLQAADLPSFDVAASGVRIDPIAGDWFGHTGPVQSLTGMAMAVLRLAPRSALAIPIPQGRTVFCYVVRGAVDISGTHAPAFNLAELSDGDGVEIASPQGSVMLLGHGPAFQEPIVSRGPFVMNTRAEIEQAIHDYQAGLFGDM